MKRNRNPADKEEGSEGEKEQGSGRSIIMLPPVVFRIIPQGFDIEVDRTAGRLWPILHSE